MTKLSIKLREITDINPAKKHYDVVSIHNECCYVYQYLISAIVKKLKKAAINGRRAVRFGCIPDGLYQLVSVWARTERFAVVEHDGKDYIDLFW